MQKNNTFLFSCTPTLSLVFSCFKSDCVSPETVESLIHSLCELTAWVSFCSCASHETLPILIISPGILCSYFPSLAFGRLGSLPFRPNLFFHISIFTLRPYFDTSWYKDDLHKFWENSKERLTFYIKLKITKISDIWVNIAFLGDY